MMGLEGAHSLDLEADRANGLGDEEVVAAVGIGCIGCIDLAAHSPVGRIAAGCRSMGRTWFLLSSGDVVDGGAEVTCVGLNVCWFDAAVSSKKIYRKNRKVEV